MQKKVRLALLLSVIFVLVESVSIFAQERVGALRGTAFDSTGAVIPDVKVEVAGPGLIKPLGVTTNAGGGYLFQSLPPGVY